jgi:hypothetical protein
LNGKARREDDPEIRRPASNLNAVFLAELRGKWNMDPRVKKQGAALRAVEVLEGLFLCFPNTGGKSSLRAMEGKSVWQAFFVPWPTPPEGWGTPPNLSSFFLYSGVFAKLSFILKSTSFSQ